jgi:hypothetical protein
MPLKAKKKAYLIVILDEGKPCGRCQSDIASLPKYEVLVEKFI